MQSMCEGLKWGVLSGFDWLTASVGEVGSPPPLSLSLPICLSLQAQLNGSVLPLPVFSSFSEKTRSDLKYFFFALHVFPPFPMSHSEFICLNIHLISGPQIRKARHSTFSPPLKRNFLLFLSESLCLFNHSLLQL